MDEYISREAVLAHKWEVRVYDPNDPDPVSEVVSVSSILQIPAADVVEVRHGQWKSRRKWNCYVCTECSFENDRAYTYCPNCGARMDGGSMTNG